MPYQPARMLHVDLSSGRTSRYDVPLADQRAFLGGASLGARLLYPEADPERGRTSAESPILLLTGPLTGTAGPAVGRAVFCGRSPATGIWAESNIGGFLGPELRAAGFDGLWITGQAEEPVYLWLHDGDLEIRSAKSLWGVADTYETQVHIRSEVGEALARVACIGTAGERGVGFASILCDHGRAAGRTGLGALLGSKRIKAIALRGRKAPPLHDPEGFASLRRSVNHELKEDNITRTLRAGGTAVGIEYWHYLGTLPGYYFSRAAMPTVGQVSGGTVAETILVRPRACHGCVIACGREVRLADGADRKGLEYETTVGFGPNLGIDDIAVATLLGEACDRWGMDTISTSNVIGLAFLAYERGLLRERDLDGLQLTWGNAEAAGELIRRIAYREGIGDLMAKGALAVAEWLGEPEMAAQVNNLEVAYHDLRGSSGMALVYATSPRGACHNQAEYFWVDTMQQALPDVGVDVYDRQAGAEKTVSVVHHQDWGTVYNALVMCLFADVPPLSTLELINRATGFEYTLEELLQVGTRGWTMKRLFNHRLGLTAANDRLPGHLLQPLPDGGAAGYVPPFDEMKAAYYAARGWDAASGRPTQATLVGLGLEEYIPDVWGARDAGGGG
jgi:aldehyde:ferredoxin oxidoreductase